MDWDLDRNSRKFLRYVYRRGRVPNDAILKKFSNAKLEHYASIEGWIAYAREDGYLLTPDNGRSWYTTSKTNVIFENEKKDLVRFWLPLAFSFAALIVSVIALLV